MMRRLSRRQALVATVGLAAVAGGTITGWWLASDSGGARIAAAADSAVLTADNEVVLRADSSAIIAEASVRAGFPVRPLEEAGYELVTADVPGPPEGLSGQTLVWLVYRVIGATSQTAEIRISESNYHRDSPVSGGRKDEPPAVELKLPVSGLVIVRVELDGGAIAFTGWYEGRTYDFGFYPPTPKDAEVASILERFFK